LFFGLLIFDLVIGAPLVPWWGQAVPGQGSSEWIRL